LLCAKNKTFFIIHEHRGVDGGLKATFSFEIKKKTLENFLIFFEKMLNLGKKQNFDDFWQKFEYFSIIYLILGQIFEDNFGDPCDYHKLLCFYAFFKKGTPPPTTFCRLMYVLYVGKQKFNSSFVKGSLFWSSC